MHLRSCRLWPAVLALGFLAACGSNKSADTTISSAQVHDAVAQLDNVIADVMTRTGIPGMAVAVVHNGETIYSKGFGVRLVTEPALVDADTVFQLASLSKSVGASVVAAQVGKGIVDWSTPLTRHLPWFALSDPQATTQLTIGDLYAHRSGLPDHAGDDLEEIGYSRRQILEKLRFLPTKPLRSEYFYTNFGLTAGAQAVAVAAGTDWESLSEQDIYRPLGMQSTSSRYADFIARTNRASPHIGVNGQFQPGPQRQPDAQSPAGGVSSSAHDMARWMKLILASGAYEGEQIIRSDALLPALSPQMQTSPATEDSAAGYYGYGFNLSTSSLGHVMYGHSGAFIMGTGTAFSLLPAANTGIVVLTNAWPVGAAEAVSLTYMDLVQFGRAHEDWVAFLKPYFAAMTAPEGELAGLPFPGNPIPPLPAHAYTGVYFNDYFGQASVEQAGGKLNLVMGPAGQTFPLQHWDGNTYVFEPDGEVAAPGSRSSVRFGIGPAGMAQDLSIEVFDKEGMGTLLRQ